MAMRVAGFYIEEDMFNRLARMRGIEITDRNKYGFELGGYDILPTLVPGVRPFDEHGRALSLVELVEQRVIHG